MRFIKNIPHVFLGSQGNIYIYVYKKKHSFPNSQFCEFLTLGSSLLIVLRPISVNF